MSTAEIRQAPGWWPSLVRVVCEECGLTGPVRDLNEGRIATTRVRIERDSHVCGQDDEDGSG